MIQLLDKLKGRFLTPGVSIGLDIGSSHIKLVALEKKGKEKILKKVAAIPLTPGSDSAITIKNFMSSHGFSAGQVNISVSGPSVIMRYISFPQMNLSELKSTMQFEAKQYIPFALDEMFLDCAIVKEKVENNKMLVVLAAIKKLIAQERIALIERAGYSVKALDVDCFCLANTFMMSNQALQDTLPQSIGLLNIGSRTTNMAIIESGSLRFSRDIAFGEQETSLHNLAQEINSSIDYYENQSGKPVDKIFTSGGAMVNEAALNFLTHQLTIPLELLNVFSRVQIDASLLPDELKAKASLYAIALGLALR